jgi:MFS-type transporter involved in bile tolerance (Atg22 family)
LSEAISEADLGVTPPLAYDPRARLSLGATCWSLFEGVRNPYVILITIYIFMPYVRRWWATRCGARR